MVLYQQTGSFPRSLPCSSPGNAATLQIIVQWPLRQLFVKFWKGPWLITSMSMSSLCLSNPNQHGFTSRKSCVTQLTNAIHNWASILDAPHPPRIDVIFLDFSKAFDVMPHHILLDKLARLYNIRGQTWTWLKSFLLNRKQRVLYKGSFSDWAPVTS